MIKIFDTNVIVEYPNIILKEKDLAIPYCILNELEAIKRTRDGLGFNARNAIRNILKKEDEILFINHHSSTGLSADDYLIKICTDEGFELVTKDILLYLRAKSKKVNVKYFQENNDIYTGIKYKKLPDEFVDKAYKQSYLEVGSHPFFKDVKENQFFDADRLILRRKDGKMFLINWDDKYALSKDFKLNRRQLMAFDLLMDKTVPVNAIWGKYGTGKTSLVIRTALRLFNKDMYKKIIVSRPKIETGFKEENLGTLPGDVLEKYSPFLKCFEDNATRTQFNMFEVQPLTTIKGRDIKDTIFIIDEAQDISPDKMPMIIERLGKNSKLILLGDPNQIDNRGLTKFNNGLIFTINNLKDYENFGSIQLVENERSKTAMLGEELRKCLE